MRVCVYGHESREVLCEEGRSGNEKEKGERKASHVCPRMQSLDLNTCCMCMTWKQRETIGGVGEEGGAREVNMNRNNIREDVLMKPAIFVL